MEVEIISVDKIPSRKINPGKWATLLDQLRDLPEGQAIKVSINGQNKNKNSTSAALYNGATRRGIKVSLRFVGDDLYLSRRD